MASADSASPAIAPTPSQRTVNRSANFPAHVSRVALARVPAV